MAMKKITRRWLVNGLGVIFVILLGVMIAFSFGVRSFYYSSVQQIIISRSSVISTLLQTYAQDSSVNFSQVQLPAFTSVYKSSPACSASAALK